MSDHPNRQGELVQSPTADRWTVYEPNSDSLHVLNASAKAIWELCDGLTSTSEMAEAISELTGVTLTQATSDVETTLSTLRLINLVSD